MSTISNPRFAEVNPGYARSRFDRIMISPPGLPSYLAIPAANHLVDQFHEANQIRRMELKPTDSS